MPLAFGKAFGPTILSKLAFAPTLMYRGDRPARLAAAAA